LLGVRLTIRPPETITVMSGWGAAPVPSITVTCSMVTSEPDRMTRVRIAADIAEAERPSVQVLATDSPRFRMMVDQTRASRGADFSVCDISLPVQVTN
jgi:hypothetical protein